MAGLDERIAVVTGATGLIGGAVVRRLAAGGARVAVASREPARAAAWIQAHPDLASRLLAIQLELGDPDSIAAAFAHVSQAFGAPTVLVANASRREDLDTAWAALGHAEFERLFNVDVAGHFLCARQLVEGLRVPRGASIVLMSSVYGLAGVDASIYPEGVAGTPVQYAAVKAALLGMARHLAGRWGVAGVRVNAVVAGGVREDGAASDELSENYGRRTMLGRMARPDEIAAAVAFLASNESSYVTGTSLVVDGGLTAW